MVASVGNLSNGLKGATAQVTTSVGNGKTLELKEMKLGDAGTFSGSVQLPAPKITAIVDADFSNPLNPLYREISVSLSEDVVAKAELNSQAKEEEAVKSTLVMYLHILEKDFMRM